jgi:hypothetical protein
MLDHCQPAAGYRFLVWLFNNLVKVHFLEFVLGIVESDSLEAVALRVIESTPTLVTGYGPLQLIVATAQPGCGARIANLVDNLDVVLTPIQNKALGNLNPVFRAPGQRHFHNILAFFKRPAGLGAAVGTGVIGRALMTQQT